MPHKIEKIAINNPTHDKRVKLTDKNREDIRKDYETGLFSQRDLAKKYSVSRRTIQFTLYPERQEIARKQFSERQKDGRYYSKDKHSQYMKSHRSHKKELYDKGLIKESE